MLKVKVTPIGNSMGIVLPKEALARLKAGKGDVLYLLARWFEDSSTRHP